MKFNIGDPVRIIKWERDPRIHLREVYGRVVGYHPNEERPYEVDFTYRFSMWRAYLSEEDIQDV